MKFRKTTKKRSGICAQKLTETRENMLKKLHIREKFNNNSSTIVVRRFFFNCFMLSVPFSLPTRELKKLDFVDFSLPRVYFYSLSLNFNRFFSCCKNIKFFLSLPFCRLFFYDKK